MRSPCPDLPESINNLHKIIGYTKKLKDRNADITEHTIGLYAYHKHVKSIDPSFGKKLKSAIVTNTKKPAHVAVFFEMLRRYNENLNKNCFTSPTTKQLENHGNNKTIKKESRELSQDF